MAAAVEWTEGAAGDLEQAAAYIERSSVSYSVAFVERVINAADSIARWPESGSIVPEFETPSIRELFVNRYRIIYRVRPKSVLILAVLHGARDLRSQWDTTARDSGSTPENN